MTPPLPPPLAVHHPILPHHQSHEIEASLPSISGPPTLHRGGEPTAEVQTLDSEEKGFARAGISSDRSKVVGGGGRGGRNGGCGGVVTAPNLAVTFSVGAAQEQQRKQQHVDSRTPAQTGRPSRPFSIESAASVEGGSDGSREASSYVWRVLAYLAFINPSLCFLSSLYAILILTFGLITYPIRSFFLPKDHSYKITPGLAYLLLVHLRFIYPRSTQSRHIVLPLPEDFDPVRLILVHLFSPFVSVALSAVSWILVFVWVYTEVILGEKNEGRGAEYRGVIFVKRRWEEYILIALKPKSLDSY